MVAGFREDRYYKALFEDSPMPGAWFKIDGSFLKVNKALYELLGYTEAELLPHKWSEVTNGLDIAGFQAEIDKSLNTKKAFSVRKRVVTKDGNEIWIQEHITPILSISPKSVGEVEHFLTWILPLRSQNHYIPGKPNKDGKSCLIPATNVVDVVRATFARNPKAFIIGLLLALSLSGLLSDNALEAVKVVLRLFINIDAIPTPETP